jgi:hypothetical protein
MDLNTQWNKLAIELGFQLSPKIRPFVELPSLHKMAARAVKRGDLHRAEKLLEHPAISNLLSKAFVGSATGIYRSYEFAVFRSTLGGDRGSNPAYVNIVLIFKTKYQLGLEIWRNSILSKIKKAIGVGSYVKIPENEMLDKLIAVTANLKDQARILLSDRLLQDKLLDLYRFSNTFEISDRDIRYSERGTIMGKDRAIEIMDLMTDFADVFATKA